MEGDNQVKQLMQKIEQKEKRSRMSTLLLVGIPLLAGLLFLFFSKRSIDEVVVREEMADNLFADMNTNLAAVDNSVTQIKQLETQYKQETDPTRLTQLQQQIETIRQEEIKPKLAAIESFDFGTPQKEAFKTYTVKSYAQMLNTIEEKQALTSRLKIADLNQTDLGKAYEQLNTNFTELKSEQTVLQKKYNDLLAGDLQNKYNDLAAKYKTLETKNTELNRSVIQLKAENDRLKSSTSGSDSDLKKQLRELTAQNSRLSASITDLKKMVEGLEAENNKLRGTGSSDEWKKNYDGLLVKYNRLEASYNRLKESSNTSSAIDKNWLAGELKNLDGSINRLKNN